MELDLNESQTVKIILHQSNESIFKETIMKKFIAGTTYFPWGPIVKVHEIGEYQIIEFRTEIFEGVAGTGKYEPTETKFHVYSSSHSYGSLDMALIGAISFKHDGINTRAPQYIELMLGIK